MVDTFIDYLVSQIGQPYVWGGQHTKLTPSTYSSVIDKKEARCEDKTDGFGRLYADIAKEFCEELFDQGETVLYGYDCSGLGMYWMQNIMGLYKNDMSANSLMGKCRLTQDLPKRGWWVFRLNSKGRATHIGYMISDTTLVEAKGRAYGVQETVFKPSAWNCWGIPDLFAKEISDPVATPQEGKQYVRVLGGSVYVRREGNKKAKAMGVAHKGDEYLLTGQAESGWHQIQYKGLLGYISNNPRYTKVVDA